MCKLHEVKCKICGKTAAYDYEADKEAVCFGCAEIYDSVVTFFKRKMIFHNSYRNYYTHQNTSEVQEAIRRFNLLRYDVIGFQTVTGEELPK